MIKRLHNLPETSGFRRELRSHLTPAEAYLWKHLKGRKLKGRRFNRQHGMGPFIVDFYCAKEKLVIELDGEVHNSPKAKEYDLRRTEYIRKLGYEVLRYENRQVFVGLEAVLDEIAANFKS